MRNRQWHGEQARLNTAKKYQRMQQGNRCGLDIPLQTNGTLRYAIRRVPPSPCSWEHPVSIGYTKRRTLHTLGQGYLHLFIYTCVVTCVRLGHWEPKHLRIILTPRTATYHLVIAVSVPFHQLVDRLRNARNPQVWRHSRGNGTDYRSGTWKEKVHQGRTPQQQQSRIVNRSVSLASYFPGRWKPHSGHNRETREILYAKLIDDFPLGYTHIHTQWSLPFASLSSHGISSFCRPFVRFRQSISAQQRFLGGTETS